jgi:hypothetical protein
MPQIVVKYCSGCGWKGTSAAQKAYCPNCQRKGLERVEDPKILPPPPPAPPEVPCAWPGCSLAGIYTCNALSGCGRVYCPSHYRPTSHELKEYCNLCRNPLRMLPWVLVDALTDFLVQGKKKGHPDP